MDPSGKALTTTSSAEDKAKIEKMGLAPGYHFVPTSSGTSSSSTAPKTIAQAQAQASTPGTYTLMDPSGKALSTTYSAADKAQMEKMGLATGYQFVPTSEGSAPASTPAPAPVNPADEPWPDNPTPVDPAAAAAGALATGEDVDTDNTPVFMGDQTLVTFTGSPQVFLVDKKDKTIRPFSSMAAFRALYGDKADQALALAQKQVISDSDVGAFGSFEGYSVLDGQYAIKEDGTSLRYDNSKQAMEARYGSQISTEGELKAFRALDGLLDLMAADSTTGVKASTIKSIQNDEEKIAFYLNALTYGGYGLADIYRDLKKDELGLSNVSPISSSQTRAQYASTDEGKKAYENVQISPPSDLVGLTADILALPIYNMPDEAFKTLVPLLDWNSEEFKAKMDEVQSAYHDVVMQQLSATTEHDKTIADYNWEKFKEETERSFGIRLSDNALTAWDQLEAARDSFSERGATGSGIEAESMDDYLRRIRTADERSREERKVTETTNEANYFLSYATPEQIQALINEDKAKGLPQSEWRASKWGLIPSEDVKAGLSLSALKKKFPEMSDEDLARYVSTVVDENGNYRSNLYQNYVKNKMAEEDNFKQYQMDTVLAKELQKEEEAYKQYTTPESPFLRTDGDPIDPATDPIKLTMPDAATSKYSGKTPGAINDMSKISGNANIKAPKEYTPAVPQTKAPGAQVTNPVGTAPKSTQITPTGTYTLMDPSGKVINTTYSQADKASMEKMGLASGYKFVPTSSSVTPAKTTVTNPISTGTTSATKTAASSLGSTPTKTPTTSTGTSGTSSKTTVKSPTGGTFSIDSSYLTADKKKGLADKGYTFI